MRRKLTTLRSKQGHSQNGAPRTLIDLALYREHRAAINFLIFPPRRYDSEYSGWSNASRPRDQAISLRGTFPNQG